MKQNYHAQALYLALLALLLLTGLSLLPANLSIGDFDLRPMDIFADVRDSSRIATAPPNTDPAPPEPVAEDTLAGQIEEPPSDSVHILQPKDSVFFGKIIEDYTPEQRGLHRFFAAVDSIAKGRTVRVAWYGDSFVEGDILVGDLRDTLQSVWGGAGVGFVPITSEVAQFKRSLKHIFKGWKAFSIVKKSETRPPLGLNGYAYEPQPGASLHYEGQQYFKNTRRWSQVRFFYTAESSTPMIWQASVGGQKQETLPGRPGRLSTWQWKGNEWGTTSFDLQFPEVTGLMAYGATLESGPGIYLDNFSVRGNSGGPLKLLAPEFVRQFDAVQQYDLIVLQVGLNAVTNNLNNIRWYEAELDRTFIHLKKCFPGKPILVVSVGDRGGKVGNEIVTMRGVPAIVAMQRNLARKHGLLFYDLFWGMGGPNTMLTFAENRPRLANTDYTHLTHEGGKVVGLMFAELLFREKNRGGEL